MSEGKLRCSGSPLFLKTRFGAGYVLTVSKQGRVQQDLDQNLLQLIQTAVPQASLASSIAGEVIFSLPITSAPSFGQLFQLIKAHKAEYLLSSYGICITTLEQVFIQLAHESKSEQDQVDDEEENDGLSPLYAALHQLGEVIHPHASKRIVSPIPIPLSEENDHQAIEMVAKALPHEADRVQDKYQAEVTPAAQYQPLTLHDPPVATLGHGNNSDPEKDFAGTAHDLVGWKENQLAEKIATQLWELLRKRWVIALRDPNGLFFQLVLPAIQIALILSILTINVNPAGHSLILNAGMFPVHPTALYSEGPHLSSYQSSLHSNLNQVRMNLVNTSSNITTSFESSEAMLATYSDPGGNRFGAYVFDDRIAANVTVDWVWVSDNLELILNNSDAIISLLESNGVIPGSNLQDVLSLNQDFHQTIPNFILDALNISSSGNPTVNISDVIHTFVDNLLGNNTEIKIFNRTLSESDLIDALESIFLPPNSSSTSINITDILVDGSVQISSIQIVNGEVVLVGVTLEVNNVTLINLGNLTLSAEELKGFLPNSTITYTLEIFSPYSILHNASSPHGVAAFMGELNAAVLQVSLTLLLLSLCLLVLH
jgi:hypothetical protein